jgi:RimJ/RimL family protein N-acetyltransferase
MKFEKINKLRYNKRELWESERMKFLKDNTIVDIMEASVEDAEELLELYELVKNETSFLIMDDSDADFNLEKEIEYLKKCNESVTSKVFVAKIDGRIVGDCWLTGHMSDKTKHNVCLGVAVLKEYWHKGLGRLLIEHTINYARITTEIKNIYLEVRKDNEFAIKLYESLGFIKTGDMPDKIFIDGKYIDEQIFVLKI